jgi:hypothetical protein
VPKAKGVGRFERPAKAKDVLLSNDEDDDKENGDSETTASSSSSFSFSSSFAFARFVPRTRTSASNEVDRQGAEKSPGASEADREPRLEVRGAFAKAVARRARRADGAVAALDGETVPRARTNVDARASPRSAVSSAGSEKNTEEKRLPTLACGLGNGSFAFASRSTSRGFGLPSFDDDADSDAFSLGDEAHSEESFDCENSSPASYDFPSPAPSAAAAFIGLSRTSPASAYSAYEREGSAPPTPPQFVLKGGFSELEHALYSGATVAFCGGGGERSAGSVAKSFATRDPARNVDPLAITTSFEKRSFDFDAPTLGAGGFTDSEDSAARDARDCGGGSRSDSDDASDDDSAEDSFDGFEGLRTPGLPDFAPTRIVSIETPPGSRAEGTKSLSPRSAAIRAETENGMATRIQAAFRGMRARRRVDALLSSSER